MPWPPQDATTPWKIIHLMVTGLLPFFATLRVDGQENVPATGGAVLACNHPGGWKAAALGNHSSPRQIYYMAKQELFEFQPWFSALDHLGGCIPHPSWYKRYGCHRTQHPAGAGWQCAGHVPGGHAEQRRPAGKAQAGRSAHRSADRRTPHPLRGYGHPRTAQRVEEPLAPYTADRGALWPAHSLHRRPGGQRGHPTHERRTDARHCPPSPAGAAGAVWGRVVAVFNRTFLVHPRLCGKMPHLRLPNVPSTKRGARRPGVSHLFLLIEETSNLES